MTKEQLNKILQIENVSGITRIKNSSYWTGYILFGVQFSKSHKIENISSMTWNKRGKKGIELSILHPELLIPIWNILDKPSKKKIVNYFMSNKELKQAQIKDDVKNYPEELAAIFLFK